MRVLFADGDPCIINLLTKIISSKVELIADESYHGEEIWELANKNKPDLVILCLGNVQWRNDPLNIGRHELSLQLIRLLKDKLNVPVITTWAYNGEHEFVDRVKAACDWYFVLPFKLEDFLAAFDELLQKNPKP